MPIKVTLSRRRFLQRAALAAGAAVALPYFVPARALGQAGAAAPSGRITMGLIGIGGRGPDVMGHFLLQKDVQWLGVCDVRADRRAAGKRQVDAKQGNADCATYNDFRELLARPDLDAVLIATGSHWHAVASMYAARAGKDVYCEKPCTMTVAEGQALVATIKRLGTVYQAGHQRRSVDSFRFMAEVVRTGLIGKLHSIIGTCWEGPVFGPEASKPVPAGFDYDLWLGPTPWHPYTNARVAGRTYFWDTGGGVMLDMGCHWTDMAQFIRQMDHTVPVEYEGEAEFPPASAFSELPVRGEFRATYADGVQFIMRQAGAFDDRYIRCEGSEGWIQLVDGTNVVTAQPASILARRGISAKGWGDPGDHVRNFLDAIKTRNQRTTAHVESAHRASIIGHAGNLCLRLGRKLKLDPVTERFVGDEEAQRMCARAVRPPWHL